jgi:hypothetical protein
MKICILDLDAEKVIGRDQNTRAESNSERFSGDRRWSLIHKFHIMKDAPARNGLVTFQARLLFSFGTAIW